VPSTTERKRILFLCTGNAARSQMAEALARIDYGDLIDPFSAGSRPAGFVHPLAIHVIEELGFGMATAHSKGAEEFRDSRFDLVVTVCASAAADCPTWPGARHLVHWAIEDPSFFKGGDQARLEAFRATRDELRQRIDSLMEALRRSHQRRTDAKLLEEGAHILVDILKPHGFRLGRVHEAESAGRKHAEVRFDRRGRSLELQVRSGVTLAAYVVGEHRLLHPHYMERLGVASQMRYPGLSKDPLDSFRRLRSDMVRFGGPFLTGSGIKEFRRLARAKSA